MNQGNTDEMYYGKDQYYGIAAHSAADRTLGNLQEDLWVSFPSFSQCLPQQ